MIILPHPANPVPIYVDSPGTSRYFRHFRE